MPASLSRNIEQLFEDLLKTAAHPALRLNIEDTIDSGLPQNCAQELYRRTIPTLRTTEAGFPSKKQFENYYRHARLYRREIGDCHVITPARPADEVFPAQGDKIAGETDHAAGTGLHPHLTENTEVPDRVPRELRRRSLIVWRAPLPLRASRRRDRSVEHQKQESYFYYQRNNLSITRTGTVLIDQLSSPFPNWPYPLAPQVQTVPICKTAVCA